jgi:hypothetical protein
MSRENLTETITNAVRDLGFARIPLSAVVDAFGSGEQVSFAVQDELKSLAESQGCSFYVRDDFVVFYPEGSEPPEGVV